MRVQAAVELDSALQLVVVRNNQVILAPESQAFVDSAEYGQQGHAVVERLHPTPDLRQVVLDPLRRSGTPVVRSVPTEVIAEQFRAGDPIASIAESYELRTDEVEAALRYELLVESGEAA
jgi:uncharacterized protein (DUF433 family)